MSLFCRLPAFAAGWLALLSGGTLLAAETAGQEERRWSEARERMVREEVVGAGISNERVCAALRDTPRHLFVPVSQRQLAYFDMALPIGGGQTISPPFIVANMTQALDPQPSDKVLEIGTGSGYQAAVLSHLVAEVYSIEIVESLGRTAEQTLRRLNYSNVHTRIGDGFQGWSEQSPFDKIIVTCSPEKIPAPLVEQLREGGTIVIPLGQRYQQTLYRFQKVAGKLKSEVLEPTFFVPMTGTAEQQRERRDDSGVSQLVNGGFESIDDENRPLGWYYVRQGQIVAAGGSAGGQRCLCFRNETPGRGAQALQALGMDGRQVRELDVSIAVEARGVRPGPSAQDLPRLALSFFDEQRAPLGTQIVGPWTGTIPWTTKQKQIRVPARCRLAVLAVGLFGAVGEFSVDEISVRATNE